VLVRYEGDGAGRRRVLVASLGDSKKAGVTSLRKATVAAINKCKSLKVDTAELQLPQLAGVAPAVVAQTVVQAATLTNYVFDRYLTTSDKVRACLIVSAAEVALS
jgi:hypothetical protein